jgi:hypothetical protein
MMRAFVVISASAIVVAACNQIVDGGGGVIRERKLAWISFYSMDSVVFTVPDTVQRSVPFEVSVRSYAGGCDEKGDTELTLDAQIAEMRPFDVHHRGPDLACPDILKFFQHVAVVRFEFAGNASVRVRGIAYPGDSVIVRERSVFVR